MLARYRAWLTAAQLLVLVLAPLPARGGRAYASIRRPEQLTVGLSDEFLGQLSPDGHTLFFLSDRNVLHEVYHQDLEAARTVAVFDEGADVTWVRVSPDAQQLLYISFRDEAAGQLCVRALQTTHKTLGSREVTARTGRRCLEDGSRAVQAQWISPTEIALVSRPSLQGDLRLSRVTVGRTLSSRPLLDRNLTSPTLTPDGRWLVYVPVQRYIDGVGPGFAARAAPHLEAVHIDDAGRAGAAQKLALDLPGQSGQPAFSPDGKYLYFAQFFNDTNRDGTIDASDHGVLFRVAFSGDKNDAPALAAHAFPEQLTDASWNCQYPSPAAQRLIATCVHGSNLDVYSLPPDGVVPSDWDVDRLRLEIELSTRRNDLLLMYRHLLQREQNPAQRHLDMSRLIMLHLEMEEFDAAEFYAKELELVSGDPVVAGLGTVMLAHIAHRQGLNKRERGRAGTFRQESRARMEALSPDDLVPAENDKTKPRGPVGAAAAALRQIVRSEITDALGDKEDAREELEDASLDDVAVPAVLQAYYERADALYRELDDPAELYAVGRKLSTHPQLLPEERLRYARAAVRTLCRGLPIEQAQSALVSEKTATKADSELDFALSLQQIVLSIRGTQPPAAVQEALLALYKKQTRPERRHAVMTDAGERATEEDAAQILETLVQVYVDDVPKGTRERQRVERLYQRVMEGRAYRERAAGQLDKARDDFALVAQATGSLESIVEYIDLRLREGKTPAAIEAEYAHPGAGHSDAVLRFVRVYLIVLQLPHMDPRHLTAAVQQGADLLRGAWHALNGEPVARLLYGAMLHEQFLSTNNLEAAQQADIHYLVAMNLLDNPRYRALALEQLGLLQAKARNYRIALGYLQEREQLPFPEPGARLVHYLIKAETLAHLEQEGEAAKAMEAALAACDAEADLTEYRPLILDRAGLYHLASGQFARALALYDMAVPLIEKKASASPALSLDPAAARNHVVVRLSRAAAALGDKQPQRALADLAVVDEKLSDPRMSEALRWPHTTGPDSLHAYRIIAAGLRARAHRGTGQLDEASRALALQTRLLQERQKRGQVEEHLRPLALAEGQLAELMYERGDAPGAGQWLRRALDHAQEFTRRTKISVGPDELALLWLAAELHIKTAGRLGLPLSDRLRTAQEHLLKGNAHTLRGYGRLLEMYLPLVGP